MQPIEFPEANITLGAAQPQYQALPAHLGGFPEIVITTCWQLTADELSAIAANGGRLWISQITFGKAFQPQLPSVERPAFD